MAQTAGCVEHELLDKNEPMPLVFEFTERATQAICDDVLAAFNAIPKRGAETGGILLGTRTADLVQVEEYFPIPCEHRFGPSFHLSPLDRRGLDELLSRSPEKNLGFCRSHTGETEAFDEQDAELMKAHFAEPGGVLLLLRPTRRQTIEGRLFVQSFGGLTEVSAQTPWTGSGPIVSGPSGALSEETNGEAPVGPMAAMAESIPPATFTNGGLAEVSEEAPWSGPETMEPPPVVPTPEAVAARISREERPQPIRAQPPDPSAQAAWNEILARHRAQQTQHEASAWSRKWMWIWAAAAVIVGVFLGAAAYRYLAPRTPVHEPAPPTVATVPPPAPPAEPPPTPPDTSANRSAAAPSTSNVEDQVRQSIDHWERALRSGDRRAIGACYMPRARPAGGSRSSRPGILHISDLAITLVSPVHAIANLRKHWQTGGTRGYAGEEQERLTLYKAGGAWKIESEQAHVVWTQPVR
jgi:hypothetical protein